MARTLFISTTLLALMALGLLAVVVAGRGSVGPGHTGDEASSDHEHAVSDKTSRDGGCAPDAKTVSIVAEISSKYTNESQLVEDADNVFIGRVLRELAGIPPSRNSPPLPTSRFVVEVQKNITGSLSGTVTVNQAGGCDPRYGHILLINEDPLLKPGDEAVLSTSRDPSGGHSLIAYQYSHEDIETPAQRARVVAGFEEAARELRSSR